jgi:N-acetylglucosaminyldiphosphoundecaprenol N-acetyl-beta-D-mannosaminyltransferase
MKTLPKTQILKVSFSTSPESEILEYIDDCLHKTSPKVVIVTPNPELVVMATEDRAYRNVLNSAQISLPDGIGIVKAAQLLGIEIDHRITGVDFMKKLCDHVSKQTVNTGFFGAKPGVAERTVECLHRENPELSVTYVSHEWDEAKARKSNIDILFVALGSPKQEQWIYDNLDRLPVKVVMGVGGSFDMIAGTVMRAPGIIQKLGFEWLWRLTVQPWRAKRQVRLIKFIWLILKEKFN